MCSFLWLTERGETALGGNKESKPMVCSLCFVSPSGSAVNSSRPFQFTIIDFFVNFMDPFRFP